VSRRVTVPLTVTLLLGLTGATVTGAGTTAGTAAAQSRCDSPVTGEPLPVDVPLPHRLSTGAGVPVLLIDTGVAVPGATGDRDSCVLHGTAVAGVLRTVAPDAGIRSVRQDPVRGTVADLVTALEDAAEAGRRDGLRIVNMSLVACEDTAELRHAVDDVTAAGVLMVASAGNTGQCGDGQAPFPASLPQVLTVGAVDPRTPDATSVAELRAGRQVADYSVTGPWVDLHAPGGPVSAVLGGDADGAGELTVVGSPGPFTGTSFAAPVVSAAAALVWQVRPELGPAEVRDLLLATAQPGPAPVVDPAAAVAAALDGPPVPRPRDAPWPDAVPVVRASPGRPDLRLPLVLGAVVLAAVLGAAALCRPDRPR
jgi:membrane-anchored mycosin MYCP